MSVVMSYHCMYAAAVKLSVSRPRAKARAWRREREARATACWPTDTAVWAATDRRCSTGFTRSESVEKERERDREKERESGQSVGQSICCVICPSITVSPLR